MNTTFTFKDRSAFLFEKRTKMYLGYSSENTAEKEASLLVQKLIQCKQYRRPAGKRGV